MKNKVKRNPNRLWLTDGQRYELAKENNRRLRKLKNEPTPAEWRQIFNETVIGACGDY